jgi:hypothetical protein
MEPAKSRKRKRSAKAPRRNNHRSDEAVPDHDPWEGVPESTRRNIERVTGKIARDYWKNKKNDDDNNEEQSDSSVASSHVLSHWQEVFAEQLDLPHVSTDDLDECLLTRNKNATLESLLALAIEKFHQNERAVQVFHMLDEAGKGCVVGSDVLRAIQELGGLSPMSDEKDDIQPEQVQEMMQEFCSTDDDLLTKDDIIRIARIVNL